MVGEEIKVDGQTVRGGGGGGIETNGDRLKCSQMISI